MKHRKLTAGAAGLSITAAVAIGAVGAAGARSAVPSKVVVKQKYAQKLVPNRYLQDGMRFNRDVYTVASGGTVEFRMTAPQEGPHTFTVVAAKDLPKTAHEAFNCKVCNTLAKAHGADPNSNAPPKFQFLENGVGQNTPPHLDRAGDSGFLAPPKGSTITFKVTARKGTTLTFMCLIHPWMQAKLKVR
jgi:plastocyanin